MLHDADGNPYAGVADTLHSAADHLEKERNKGLLEFLLDTRPAIDALSSANIVEPVQVRCLCEELKAKEYEIRSFGDRSLQVFSQLESI